MEECKVMSWGRGPHMRGWGLRKANGDVRMRRVGAARGRLWELPVLGVGHGHYRRGSDGGGRRGGGRKAGEGEVGGR